MIPAITILLMFLLFPGFAMANEYNDIEDRNIKNDNMVEINGKRVDKTKLPVIKCGQVITLNENESKIFVLERDEENKLIIELVTSEKPLQNNSGDIGILADYQWIEASITVLCKSWIGIDSGKCTLTHEFAYDGTKIPTWHRPYVTPTDSWPNYWSDTYASAAYLNTTKTKAEAIGSAKYHNAVVIPPVGSITYNTWILKMKITENGDGGWFATHWTV